jgi:hypothetical protein
MSAGNNTLPLAEQSQAQYHLYLSRFPTSIRMGSTAEEGEKN